VSSFVTGAIFRIGLDRGDSEVLSNPALITANGLSQSADGTLLVSDRLSIVEVGHGGSLRRVACLPVDMHFTVTGAVISSGVLCALTADGRLMQRAADEQSFRELTITGTDDPLSCIAAFGPLVLVGRGNELLAIEASGAIRRSITTGLRVTAAAAFDDNVVVCERGTGTVALFDSGTATVWTGFSDPAAVALTAEAVFVAEESARQIVRIERSTGERAIVATQLPFGSPLAEHANGVGPPSLCATADGAIVVGCSGDASLRRLTSMAGRV